MDDIDKLLNINNHVEKSRITSLYACVPRGCEVFTGFEQSRNFAFDNLSWDYWKRLINQTFDCKCDFIYLLNSPRPLDIENPDFPQQLEKLELLLTELRKIGVKKLRVASVQLMSYIGKHYSDFDVLASTSLEYKTIWEYQNFIYFHPEIKEIVPSHDVNKNFKLLSILKKKYPNIELEIIVNEGCLQGCPNRILHQQINIDKYENFYTDECFSSSYCISFCNPLVTQYPIQSLVIGNLIFPWDIKEYSNIGITKFKFVGRDWYLRDFDSYIESFKFYLMGVDDINSIQNVSLADFTHHLRNNSILKELLVKEYKKHLPNINYFKKYGHLCSSRCSFECRYCYKCSEKIVKMFKKKQMEKQKRDIFVYIK